MYTTAIRDADFERNVIDRIAASWNYRVAVRGERLDLSQYYDASIPDFPTRMVPVWTAPEMQALPRPEQLRFLAAAWIGYNEKAIYLEDEIVQPLCSLLLKGRLPGLGDPLAKQVIAQVQVDEQFHILMCLEICNSARERHDLHAYRMPEPVIGRHMKARIAAAADEQEIIMIRLAYAAVAEMSINAYLNEVATDQTIQPLNRINTDMHRRDEAAHNTIFRQIVGSVYRGLTEDEQARFRPILEAALKDYTEPDVEFWNSLLVFFDIEGRERIVEELVASLRSRPQRRDYTGILDLFEALDIADKVDFPFHLHALPDTPAGPRSAGAARG